ncbi:MAG: 16S rRNA (cytosine(1402)-N(4))-methyltransferase RsmH [Gammaproteobacteria bacterium]|nr:16S rRNA (cytosine(1402)-N(4))-methyltransferase RsmH [Gammaproteobacteria bacterium]MDH5303457.1 16S rRNA (cytosine(1402)-N(4))-methyltransferase RsmH [Gammaproteobacteria bacterium]MDH5321806.1 16S rRNA (cytosine(1402)-N(4))-methyltransferase RsmH [Gammaproteobacteria bacterium]
MNGNPHVPVLLGPVLDGLDIKRDGCYVDATFGRGGHATAILERLGTNGRLIAIDRDAQAIASASASLANDSRVQLIRNDFANLAACMGERGLTGQVDGLLLDLGVSSPQLDQADRGFSFLRDGPLDMRMDTQQRLDAAGWLASVDEKTLKRVLYEYGEEQAAPRIARAIVSARAIAAIESTGRLAGIVESVVPAHARKKHPATKTFQAIRIFINDELQQLEAVLQQSITVLRHGGRLCVISFHSLEDRIVKRFMRAASRESEQYRGMPIVPAEFQPRLRLVGKDIVASSAEIALNPRARSARLRVAERI